MEALPLRVSRTRPENAIHKCRNVEFAQGVVSNSARSWRSCLNISHLNIAISTVSASPARKLLARSRKRLASHFLKRQAPACQEGNSS